ncbi:hypothetical protein IP84_16880 [beta proteobacterium AAP99]|nr:hypothetical protein IP84_16880 [beta proteobacterium AAP99]
MAPSGQSKDLRFINALVQGIGDAYKSIIVNHPSLKEEADAALESARAPMLNILSTPEAPTITLRDYFAAKAMLGMMDAGMPTSEIVSEAYAIADAMLQARNQ